MNTQLRLGNVYTANGIVCFIELVITHYNECFPETTPFLNLGGFFSSFDFIDKNSFLTLSINAQQQYFEVIKCSQVIRSFVTFHFSNFTN